MKIWEFENQVKFVNHSFNRFAALSRFHPTLVWRRATVRRLARLIGSRWRRLPSNRSGVGTNRLSPIILPLSATFERYRFLCGAACLCRSPVSNIKSLQIGPKCRSKIRCACYAVRGIVDRSALMKHLQKCDVPRTFCTEWEFQLRCHVCKVCIGAFICLARAIVTVKFWQAPMTHSSRFHVLYII